jgi:hypothetical protein
MALLDMPYIGADAIEAYFEEAEGHRTSLGSGGMVRLSGKHDWDRLGYVIVNLPDALTKFRPVLTSNVYSVAINPTTLAFPTITVVTWGSGGRHFVVVADRVGSQLVILDPLYGIQQAALDSVRNLVQPYQANDNGRICTGDWYPWFCQIKKSS